MNTLFGQGFRFWTNNTLSMMKKAVLSSALCLGIAALGAGSAFAQPATGGNDTNINIAVPACTTLNAQVVPVPAGAVRYCTATGSADTVNPGNVGLSTYVFNLTLDNVACAPLDGGKERTLQFSNLVASTSLPDVRIKEVSSTGFFVIPAGVHVLRWTARPVGSPATTVIDRSLSVVCTDYRLPPVLTPTN